MTDHPIGHSPVEDLDVDTDGGFADAVPARARLTTRGTPASFTVPRTRTSV